MSKGYCLGYAGGQLLVSGDPGLMRGLLDMPGAAPLYEMPRAQLPPAITLPGVRFSFLAAEALASPTVVTAEYRAARAQAMRPQQGTVRVAGLDLLPHQWDFLDWAYPRRQVLNASEQGTGKTRMAWALWHRWEAQRTLIVTPKSLCPEWAQEYQRMNIHPRPDVDFWLLSNEPIAARRQTMRAFSRSPVRSVAILNYECLVRLLPDILAYNPSLIIYDECWRLKNPRAAVSRAAHKLADKLFARTMLLTGTPVGNHVGDLWSQLRCFGKEAVPEKFWDFMHEHAVLAPVAFNGRLILKPKDVKNAAKLMGRLDPYWFRVTKEGVLDLPPKRHDVVPFTLPAATKPLYEAVKSEGQAALGAEGALDNEGVVMLRLQQIAGGHQPHPEDERGMNWGTKELPCPKLAWLEQFVRDRLEGNPAARLLVWCRFTSEANRIVAALAKIIPNKVALCIGATKPFDLEAAKLSYNSRHLEGVQVMVCQYQKMAYGHNLQATDYAVYFSPTWSYVELIQSEDRAHRHGREGAVQYFQLVMKQTIDEDAYKALARKENLAAKIAIST